MYSVYSFTDGALKEIERLQPGCWVRLIDPSVTEIDSVSKACGTNRVHLEASLDSNEVAQLQSDEGNLCVIVNIPVECEDHMGRYYGTTPVSVIATDDYVITSCLKQVPPFDEIVGQDRFELDPSDQGTFLCRILLLSAMLYQRYLGMIDAERQKMVESLGRRTSDSDLLKLHRMESALVYFETGLNGNKVAFDLLADEDFMEHRGLNRELIRKVRLETEQGIKMASVYRVLVGSTRDLFSDTINNVLNSVMKILTSLTIILAVPTIISGFYGMNVPTEGMPFGTYVPAFSLIFVITLIICIIIAWWLHKKDLL